MIKSSTNKARDSPVPESTVTVQVKGCGDCLHTQVNVYTTCMMADNTALTTPLILAIVLQHLPQQDLLLAQRVCREWKYQIDTTRALQAALFFVPDQRFDNPPTTAENIQYNPLLKARFPAFLRHGEHYDEFEKHKRTDGRVNTIDDLGPWKETDWFHRVQKREEEAFGGESKADSQTPEGLNTRLQRDRIMQEARSFDEAVVRSRTEATIRPPRQDDDIRRINAYARPEASWRRMLPCKPPIRELQVMFQLMDGRSTSICLGSTLRCLIFSNEAAVSDWSAADSAVLPSWLTFGRLHDIVHESWFASDPEPALRVRFDWAFHEPTWRYPFTSVQNNRASGMTCAAQDKTLGGAGRLVVTLQDVDLREWCHPRSPAGYLELTRLRERDANFVQPFKMGRGSRVPSEWDEVLFDWVI